MSIPLCSRSIIHSDLLLGVEVKGEKVEDELNVSTLGAYRHKFPLGSFGYGAGVDVFHHNETEVGPAFDVFLDIGKLLDNVSFYADYKWRPKTGEKGLFIKTSFKF